MQKNTKWHRRFLDLAKLISTWSKDPSTQCGSVIIDGKRIVSVGYNGFPMGTNDDMSLYNDRKEKYGRVVHSELNAILLAKCNVEGYSIYVYPMPPCNECMKAIIQAGIKKVFTIEPDKETFERWKDAIKISMEMAIHSGVEIHFINNN